MEHQQWKPTVLDSSKKYTKKDLQKNALNSNVVTHVKTPGSGASGRQLQKVLNSEEITAPKPSFKLKRAIAQARNAKEWKQKDLAFAIGVKESIIGSYESGKLIPENSVIAKMEKALGCKLPRPEKAKPL